MGQRLHRLVYCSRNSFPTEVGAPAAILRSILSVSRARNATADITGALILSVGCFGQVLESPEDVLSSTFTRIKRDDRHCKVSLLAFEPIVERSFAQWSMGYVGPKPTAVAQETEHIDPAGASGAELLDLLQTLAREQLRAEAPDGDAAHVQATADGALTGTRQSRSGTRTSPNDSGERRFQPM